MPVRQLKNALAPLTATLLGTLPAVGVAASHSETSLLVYSEQNRVRATEALFTLNRDLRSGYNLNMTLTFDGLTGASPTGSSPSKHPQTITRSSGGGRIITQAGELPVDDGFTETRFAVDAMLSRRVSESVTLAGGGHVSSEHDYKSLGLKGAISKEFDNGRTTASFSAALSRDKVDPLDGVPAPFADPTVQQEDEFGRRLDLGSRRKTTTDMVAGLTRIVGPRTVLRFNYSISLANGYMTDPYKIISVVQPMNAADPGEPVQSLHENRPDNRTGHAVFGQIRKGIGRTIADLSYRYYLDNWGVTSHTAFAGIRLDLRRIGAFQPSVRWYTQSRADFSRPFLIQGDPLPDFVSADNRLAKFTAFTYGLNYELPVSPDSRLAISAEWYNQRGDPSPPESFGPLLNFDLFPDLRALMLRVGLIHEF